jgi:hypothetical protein
MPQSTLKAIILPGYAQPQNLTVTAQLEFLPDNRCIARWSIAPEADKSGIKPKEIDAGVSVIPQTPQFVLDAHQAFFDYAMPALMQSYVERHLPKVEESVEVLKDAA